MIWHPLLIAVVVGDVLGLLLWLGAAGKAFQKADTSHILHRIEHNILHWLNEHAG